MFTGIIEHQGTIQKKSASTLTIEAPLKLINELSLGASVSVNGACLTVSKIAPGKNFEAQVMPETFKKTMLGALTPGKKVNLELPLSASGRFAGHIVQGHVDGTAIIKTINRAGNSRVFNFIADKKILDYMVEKGSVTVNGISLTVIDVTDKTFSVGLIPHTWEHTTLKSARAGDRVNIEADILAKYIYKFMKAAKI